MAPRGGSGNGAQAAVVAMVQGRSPMPAAPAAPAPPATIPGALTAAPPSGPATSLPAPVITRNAAAQTLNSGAGTAAIGGPLAASPATQVTTSPASTSHTQLVENASSLPYGATSGASESGSFPYFALHVVDDYSGIDVFPGQYQ
jgi:hypothetical protein